ncbi:MAG: TIGR00159 family protein [Candidatus Marinimicrobia bacterium]|nr:TIGR00159 family protein [Candidatus Neomarinimicrobiota bacterium]
MTPILIIQIGFLNISIIDIIDIIFATWIFYKIYVYFRDTRAGQMLVGLMIIMFLSFLFNAFGLSGTSWLVNQFQTVWVVAFVILFQPELRRLLIYIGQTRFIRSIFRMGTSRTIQSIAEVTNELKQRKWGALIIVQRETGLRSYKETGTSIKAEVSTPLLLSIFNPTSPLHDGAVIIQNDILDAAGCILPLTESSMVDPEMGTRHRAALGISEETDAIVVVVSEEKQRVSMADNGRFIKVDMDEMELRRNLNQKLFLSSSD